jgi:hypothetical protein
VIISFFPQFNPEPVNPPLLVHPPGAIFPTASDANRSIGVAKRDWRSVRSSDSTTANDDRGAVSDEIPHAQID